MKLEDEDCCTDMDGCTAVIGAHTHIEQS